MIKSLTFGADTVIGFRPALPDRLELSLSNDELVATDGNSRTTVDLLRSRDYFWGVRIHVAATILTLLR